MEAPHFLHHHSHHPRSVPLPSAPPSDFPHQANRYFPPPNLENHFFSHSLPPKSMHLPPPPPPALLPPSYRPLHTLPPPPLSPYHSNQFTVPSSNYNNRFLTEGDRSGNLNFSEFHDFKTHSPRILNRIAFDSDISHHRLSEMDGSCNDNWSHLRDRSRIEADYMPVMRDSHGDIEHDLINGQYDYRPDSTYQPIDMVRGLGGNSRFMVDYNDGLIQNYGEEHGCMRGDAKFCGGSHIASKFATSLHDRSLVKGKTSSRIDIELRSGSFYDRSLSVCENELVRSARIDDPYKVKSQIARDVPNSLLEMENNTISSSEWFRMTPRKRGHNGSEVERYNSANRGNRPSSHPVNRNPRKQVQKKSAFLRLQNAKHNHRGKEDELGYSDKFDKGFGSCTGKDQNGYTSVKLGKVKEGEGSHMELDISFKSNSLIAKAVVSPSALSSMTDSKVIQTCRYKEFKNLYTSDLYLDGSKPRKLTRDTIDINDSTHHVNNSSSSGMNTKQSGEKVLGPAVSNLLKHNSKSCIKNGLGENIEAAGSMMAMVSNKEISAAGSRKRYPSGNVKNKTNVRKSVKVVNPTRKLDENVKSADIPLATSDSDLSVKPLRWNNISSGGIGVKPNVNSKSCLNSSSIIPEDKVVCDALAVMLSEECKTDANFFPLITMEDNKSDACFGSSTFGETMDTELPICEDNLVDNLTAKTITLPNKFAPLDSNSENIDKFLADTEGTLLCENKIGEESQDPISLSEGKKNEVPNSGIINGTNKQLYSNQGATVLWNDDAKEITGANFLVGNNEIVCLPPSDEIRVQNNSIVSNNFNDCPGSCDNGDTNFVENDAVINCWGTDSNSEEQSPNVSGLSLLPSDCIRVQNNSLAVNYSCDHRGFNSDKGGTKFIKNVTFFNCLGTNYAVEEPSPNASALSPDNVHVKRSPVHTIPIVSSKETVNEKGLAGSHSDSSSAGDKYMRPADSKILGNIPCGKDPETDGSGIMHKNSLLDKLCETKDSDTLDKDNSFNEMSRLCRKKRKMYIDCLSLPSPEESNEASPNFLTGGPHVYLNLNTEQTQQKKEVVASSSDDLYEGSSVPCQDEGSLGLDLDSGRKLFDTLVACSDPSSGNGMKLGSSSVTSVSHNLIIPQVQTSCLLTFGNGHRVNATKVGEEINQDQTNNVETGSEEKIMHVTEGRDMIDGKSSLRVSPDGYQSPDSGQELAIINEESHLLPEEDDSPCLPDFLPLSSDGNEGSAANCSDEVIGFVVDRLSNMASPDTGSDGTDKCMLNSEPSLPQAFPEKFYVDYKNQEEMSIAEIQSKKHANFLLSSSSKTNLNSDDVKLSLVQQMSKSVCNNRKFTTAKAMINKKRLGHTISRGFSSHSSFMYGTSKKFASSIGTVKSRTWHRADNSSSLPLQPCSSAVPSLGQFLGSNGVQQSSYIRKGNSLVRKSSPVSGIPHGSHAMNSFTELRNEVKSDSFVGDTDSSINLRIKVTENPANRLGIPPVLGSPKLLDCTISSGGCSLAEPLLNDSADFIKPRTKKESASSIGLLENSGNCKNPVLPNIENQTNISNEYLASSNFEIGAYVKSNANQLFPTLNPCDLNCTDKVQSLSSDGYYKRRKNQLIRATRDSSVSQTPSHLSDKIFKSELEYIGNDTSHKSYTGRRLAKGMPRKAAKSSSVWSLGGSVSSKYGSNNLNSQKIVPHLPWKRVYRRTRNSVTNASSSSPSTISKRLLLLRKRETLYTRSNNGFSLKKSKVLSVGGSSLKWSKSIDRRSKKANEDATLAVAAVERKKREQKGHAHVIYRTDKNSGSSSRGRIFRFGSIRYKLDPSKRTLQRISDDEPSCSIAATSGKNVKITYAPRRLVIGNDAYVRIGNGNQLVRDPKKRIRRLASEKIRWSLHTARKRLGREQKYCQFFTRYGTCDKNDGKCPYIHDPSKIAVCTKFLNDACSDVNCKLTHKIIPERMPDCSYFLQGLCTNKSCAYRHVNVNPKASTCEGFLRGYCTDGDECRKKHSYVCPIFEATGSCSESKCKLHHPKRRNGVKKRKRSGEPKNDCGRYFGSMTKNSTEPEKLPASSTTKPSLEGELGDYISLDMSDTESGELGDHSIEQTSFYNGDLLDLPLEDLDEVIKPFRLMN